MGEQLTPNDVKKIKEEIEYRKLVVRKKELEAVKEARAQGDLSENFEYKAAKQDKNRTKAGSAIWNGCSNTQKSFPISRQAMKWASTTP